MENIIKTQMSRTILFVFVFSCFSSCSDEKGQIQTEDSEWSYLIDKNLSAWDTYLSFKHQPGYDGTPPRDDSGNQIEPIGLNKPNFDVFSTLFEDDELVIKVSGEYYGCLASKDEYENYHFQLQFKWGDKKWPPRLDRLKDSGILYH
ncbi:MAG: family 16 glycoside hydrolase [Maribacter sp.]|uniref:family 16 glycoside hydrolase n=1 Tax=Maribacter sp. TaxID=1897614 RepID=UPI0032976E26